jgi:PfaD family protein
MISENRSAEDWRWGVEGASPPAGPEAIWRAIAGINRPLAVASDDESYVLADAREPFPDRGAPGREFPRLAAFVPACPIERLGDPGFLKDLGLRYPYVAGAMAGGISSVEMIVALADAGMLGVFGAGGLTAAEVETAVDRALAECGTRPFAFNLIHSPNEPALEAAVADLYLRKGVRLVEASAYLDLTLPLVRYRVKGIHRDQSGGIVAPNRIIAKASRTEVATKFFSPPPERLLRELVASGEITEEQAGLAARIPMAQDLTAEADSGGHTDNRPALALIPTMLALRDRMQARYKYPERLRVGAAGGISTPASALAAFSMGAAYILTGSINQCSVEAGTSDAVREMLAKAGQADVIMAPAADMFEMGVKVQVLKWGTMFPMRAARLYELYRTRVGIDDIPPEDRADLEKNLFKADLDTIWSETRKYFEVRDRNELGRAEADPKHKMALVFRWYLGQTARWAAAGDPDRRIDYQIYCGPAMGAFNEWVKGSYLEASGARRVVDMALNLLYGAAVLMRLGYLRAQGVEIQVESSRIRPLEPEKIKERLA